MIEKLGFRSENRSLFPLIIVENLTNYQRNKRCGYLLYLYCKKNASGFLAFLLYHIHIMLQLIHHIAQELIKLPLLKDQLVQLRSSKPVHTAIHLQILDYLQVHY